MALSAAEEETIESIKRWWHESGRILAVGVAVVVLGYLGWLQWQSMQDSRAAQASALYDQLSAIVVREPGESLSGTERDQALDLSTELREEHSGSVYALYAALFSARLNVEQNELAAAQADLEWLLDNTHSGFFSSTDETLIRTAQLRLGRVLLAQGEADRALTVISGVEPGALRAEFSELRGDIYMAQGQRAEALSAYQSASEAGSDNPFLRMKINDLAAEV